MLLLNIRELCALIIWKHFIFLDNGEVKIYLKSEVDQDVTITAINQNIHFVAGERIQTELSTKYNNEKMQKLIEGTSLKIKAKMMDVDELFADYVLEYRTWNINFNFLLHRKKSFLIYNKTAEHITITVLNLE